VRPQLRDIAIAPVMARLRDDFAPLCDHKGLRLRMVQSGSWCGRIRNFWSRSCETFCPMR